ncbi:hypothetical protein J4216_01955 [Candidatus Woesearchaeota archaeon]|nr:hypothetical protein [Candidatus Woesearchaeota archaeon]
MKVYHGSPKKIEVLIPKQAKGHNGFQNLEAVFLTDNFLEASLYAIGKSLKGKAHFGIQKGKLVIIGNASTASEGYVYEFDLPESELIKGEQKEDLGVYAYQNTLICQDPKIVKIEEIQSYIIYVKNKNELMQVLYS